VHRELQVVENDPFALHIQRVIRAKKRPHRFSSQVKPRQWRKGLERLLGCRALDGKAPGGLETARIKPLTKSVCGDLEEAGGEGKGKGKLDSSRTSICQHKGANEARQVEWLTLSQLEHRRSFQSPVVDVDAEKGGGIISPCHFIRIKLYGWTIR